MRRLVLVQHRYATRYAARLGIGPYEAMALNHLSIGPLTPTQLARALGLSPHAGAITALIDRLVSGGLAARAPHPRDRRSVLIEVTAGGRERSWAAASAYVEEVVGVIGELPREEHDVVLRFIERVIDVTTRHGDEGARGATG